MYDHILGEVTDHVVQEDWPRHRAASESQSLATLREDRERTLEWFRRVDEGPFSTLSCGERVVGSSVDMLALLGAAASVTTRVRIAPTLYVLPMHPAIRVAKHAATLDLISGGRTTVTVGASVTRPRVPETTPTTAGLPAPAHSTGAPEVPRETAQPSRSRPPPGRAMSGHSVRESACTRGRP